MENLVCFESGCNKNVEYICKCVSPDILMCKDHLNVHMESSVIPHYVQSIYIGINQMTKEVILNYVIKEKEKIEEKKKDILARFSISFIDSKRNLKQALDKVNLDLKKIDEIIKLILETEKISRHDTNPFLETLVMNPEEALERFKANIPRLSDNGEIIEIMMSYDKNIENVLNRIIEQKFQLELGPRFSQISEQFNFIEEKISRIEVMAVQQTESIKNIEIRKWTPLADIVDGHEKRISSLSNLSNEVSTKLNNQKNDEEIQAIYKDIASIYENINKLEHKILNNEVKLSEQKSEINDRLEKFTKEIEEYQAQLQENKNYLCQKIDESAQKCSSGFNLDLKTKLEDYKAQINNLISISNKNSEKEYNDLKQFLDSAVQSSKEYWELFSIEIERKLVDTKGTLIKEINILHNLRKELIKSFRKAIKGKSRIFNNKLKTQIKIFEEFNYRIGEIEQECNTLRSEINLNLRAEDLPRKTTVEDKSGNNYFPYYEIWADINSKFASFAKISSIFSELNRRTIMLTNYESTLSNILRDYWMKINQKSFTLSTYEELSEMRYKMFSLKESLMKELETNVFSLMLNEEFSALCALNPDIKNSRMEYFSNFNEIQNRFILDIEKVNEKDKAFSFYNNSKIYMTSSRLSNKTMLTIYDAENNSQASMAIEMPDLINSGACIIQIPDFKIFIFGNIPVSGMTGIIDPESQTYIDLSTGTPCYSAGGVYYEGFVYIFGGYNDGGILTLAEKFDLAANLWFKLEQLPAPAYLCSCLPFKGSILICGCDIQPVYRYDIIDNSYFTILNLNLVVQGCKTLFSGQSRVYVIDWGEGKIWESEFENEYSWHVIGYTDPMIYRQEFRTYYSGSVYVGLANDKNIYYKFSFSNKKLEKIVEFESI